MKPTIQGVSKVNGLVFIRPNVAHRQLCGIAKELFGLIIDSDSQTNEVESYDDRCFIVQGKLTPRGNSLDEAYHKYNKFVLKLFNSWTTGNIDVLEERFNKLTNCSTKLNDSLQLPYCIQLLSGNPSYLGKYEIPLLDNATFTDCSKVDLVEQGLLSEIDDGNVSAVHIVRLALFIPGKIIEFDDLSDKLSYNWGVAAGNISLIMKELSLSPSTSTNTWDTIRCVDKIREPYISSITNDRTKAVLEKIVSEFEMDILPRMQSELSLQWIHSDLNEHNMLCNDKNEIVGILDFDDNCYSYLVVDIATALMYISTGSDINNILGNAKKLFKGYCSVVELNETELNSLYHLMLMRYVVSISVGAYQYALEPDNEYLLFTQIKACERLDVLVSMGKENFLKEITSSS